MIKKTGVAVGYCRNNRIIRGSKDLVNRFLNASPDDLLNDIVELCFM